jgi:hypothetical protein
MPAVFKYYLAPRTASKLRRNRFRTFTIKKYGFD